MTPQKCNCKLKGISRILPLCSFSSNTTNFGFLYGSEGMLHRNPPQGSGECARGAAQAEGSTSRTSECSSNALWCVADNPDETVAKKKHNNYSIFKIPKMIKTSCI